MGGKANAESMCGDPDGEAAATVDGKSPTAGSAKATRWQRTPPERTCAVRPGDILKAV